MGKRARGEPSRPPKFPRRRWEPGQTERIEEPKRGGRYDRDRQKDEAQEEIEDTLPEQQNHNNEQETLNDE